MKHLLILGRPGIGKTTLMKYLIKPLRRHAIGGFITEEYRQDTRRVGFWLSALDGRQMLLAHRDLPGGMRVGPYKVNLAVLDEVAVGLIRQAAQARVLFLDELGRMELSSPLLTQAVREVLDQGPVVVATAGISSIPFLNAVKSRRDVEIIPLTAANRSAIEEELSGRLAILCVEDIAVQNIERQARRICELIVEGRVPLLDIEIQQAALREMIQKTFPEKLGAYQQLYESRFRRLWLQFRHETAL